MVSSSSNTRAIVTGIFSEGLTKAQLPQAIAYGRNHNGIIPGNLNGVTIATTPTGCRIMISSMPRAAVAPSSMTRLEDRPRTPRDQVHDEQHERDHEQDVSDLRRKARDAGDPKDS